MSHSDEGIDDLGSNQNSDNGLSDQSTRQDVIELTEADIEERDETLLQPPPMFASSDEVETEDLGEVHERENAFEFHTPSPVIPPSLLVQQPRDFKRFHNLALEVWTEEDCVDWLDYIGLGHFSPQFRENHVDGMMLKNINFQLLEEIGIDSPDEREVMLSEIYRRFHPEEEDMFEMEIQGALQSASEQERMKIMAVLNALRSPAFQAELGIAPSTGPSSPHDSYASESGSISSGMTGGSDDHYHDLAMPAPPPPPTSSQTRRSSEKDDNVRETKVKTGKLKKQRKLSKDSDKSTDKESKNEKQKQKQKKHKGMSKLLDTLSLSSSSSKLTKLFHSSSSSSTTPTKKLNPTMQYLLQAGPQGLIRIWPTALSEEMNYCSFMVNMTTTCAEIIKLVFEKYEVVDDQRRYYVCETSLSKGGAHHELLGSDCPLLFQCRWQDPDKHRFELRCKNEGVIKMLFELEGYEDDLDYRSIPLSSKTPCSEAVPLIVKKFNLPGEDCDYLLVEVSEENEDDREEVAGHVCPLRLQMAWSAPDHVFRLCRRPNEELGTNEDSKEIMLDGWTTDATDDVALERETQSELSSAQEENDQDVTPAKLGAVERDEIVEETREDLMDGLARLDSVIEEESEAIASQEMLKLKRELMEKKVEVQELQVKTAKIMAEKESEIERLLEENKQLRHGELNEVNVRILNLEKENEELKATAENFHEMKRKDDVLTVNESELHSLRLRNEELRKEAQGIEEKFKTEISLRDREIERLYARNNELASKEKELDSLNEEKSSLLAFDLQQKELEKLKLLRDEASVSQSEMTSKLEALQTRNNDLEAKIAQIENLTQINRELCQKVDEGEIIRQEFQRSEAEKKDLKAKLESLNSERKKSEQSIAEELENLREKNQFLSDQCKDADEMKKNIIKLTAQLREMEKKNQCEADSLQRKLEEFTSEKQLLHKRIAELEKTENGGEQADISQKEGEDLKLENIFLVERTREVEELKASVAKFAAEARENESFKQKYKELRDVESYLTKQVNTAETIARQKDKKLKESENKINTLTEAVKDMEAKLEEQEQNQHYLDQLLTMLKDRDPTLLHVINSSLASNEPEEWC
ncbi:centrosomal protein of 290 kDa-like isoform X4 [Acropora millepora]|uniref:centrosomal protein of 290 kDa-like isoform X4 n=1 Tax=Acropora millepora TaxID=45264 RepID=UPI001CF4695C|nr:centrosomal protein of 290 kDa-like isoform X4 [Acropora millepora]